MHVSRYYILRADNNERVIAQINAMVYYLKKMRNLYTVHMNDRSIIDLRFRD